MRHSIRSVGVPALLLATAAIAAGTGCGTGKATTAPTGPTATTITNGCKVKSNLVPTSAPQGSTVALGKVGGKGTLAFVADEDARSIIAVDVDSKKEVARTRLSAAPSQIVIGKDGRLYAALRDNSKVAVLESEATDGTLAVRCELDVASDPQGIALTPDESTLIVSSGFGHTATGFETASMKAKFALEVPREPRSIVVSDDGKTAYISHAVGSQMTMIELGDAPAVKKVSLRAKNVRAETGMVKAKRRLPSFDSSEDKAAPSCQGFALAKTIKPFGRILAPQVMVDPGDLEQLTPGYGRGSGGPSEVSSIAVVDDASHQVVDASLDAAQASSMMMRSQRGRSDAQPRMVTNECLLPRAAAVDAASGSLLVTCFGIDALVAYDQASPVPVKAERKRWPVGAGPTGVAVDDVGHRAVVWSQFDRSVQIINIASMSLEDDNAMNVPRIALAKLPAGDGPSDTFTLGRVLFHTSHDHRISNDGRACASCHPDGRDDAITWATPEGPRRSIMLAGRLKNTAPYSWLGKNSDVTQHVGHTFDRLGGAGLRGVELEALVTYVNEMHAPSPIRVDADKAKRGAEIFASKEAGCADCHKTGAGQTTDAALHNVYSKAKADEAEAFNTPSLHLVGGTGPYFHDGRYKTLGEVLRATDGKMGHTSQLSENDIDALETFVRSL